MKDALTYANEAGFFSFNVVGWKAEFERLIEAVRADALAELATVNESLTAQDHSADTGNKVLDHIAASGKPIDHIADADKMVREPVAYQEPASRAILCPPPPPEVYQMRSRDAYEAGWYEAQKQKAVSPTAPVQPIEDSRVSMWKSRYLAAASDRSKLIEENNALRAAPVEPVKQEPVAWMYCPECGSLDVRYEDGNHKQCASCAQEWFSDIDYSDEVRQNLNRLHAAPIDAKAIRAEALEDAVKFLEENGMIAPNGFTAAGIRGLK